MAAGWVKGPSKQLGCRKDVQLKNFQNEIHKPLPQGGLGGILGLLGVVIVVLFIIGGAVTIFIIYRRQKRNRSDTENDLIDLPSSQKPASLPLNQNQEVKSQLTAENIQVVHLDNTKEQEEEVQKTSSQPPYYDIAASESTPNTDKLTAGNNKDSNVQYAELDTSVLTTSSPSHKTSVPTGGDLVEYATIQANVC